MRHIIAAALILTLLLPSTADAHKITTYNDDGTRREWHNVELADPTVGALADGYIWVRASGCTRQYRRWAMDSVKLGVYINSEVYDLARNTFPRVTLNDNNCYSHITSYYVGPAVARVRVDCRWRNQWGYTWDCIPEWHIHRKTIT